MKLTDQFQVRQARTFKHGRQRWIKATVQIGPLIIPNVIVSPQAVSWPGLSRGDALTFTSAALRSEVEEALRQLAISANKRRRAAA